ncbi:MAG: 16S rRNA (cytidine(1402)-2'-O)-methyltransferase [Epsilonproteobacteria bacterium]|nr:16S rRNA (cytidine(1402)-2'-O)-methyltransferase [Campylobacterota bacterium]
MLNLVPTPIGNIKDITLRALEALKEAEIVYCEDTRVTKKLFNLLEIPLNKDFISMHSHNEAKIIQNLDPNTLKTKNCIYVSDAGMPAISDPGSKLVRFCQQHDIPYSVLPGANAAVCAFAASGFEGEWCFIGFLPHKGKEREKKLKDALFSGKISILYESPHRIEKLINELKKLIPQRKIFLAKEISKMHETFILTTPEKLTLSNTKGEWVVIIDKEETKNPTLHYDDIASLDLPPKQKAKLLAKITGKNAKELYEELIKNK